LLVAPTALDVTDTEPTTRPGRAPGRLRRRWQRRTRWSTRRRIISGLVVALGMLLLPVPWMHVVGDDPLSHAWRLDGRLFVEGTAVDPDGRWSWLAIGRPPLVIELLSDRIRGRESGAVDMRAGPVVQTPALSDPAAAAVGLRYAGRDVPMRLLIEVRDPLVPGIPDTAIITMIEGIELSDRATWNAFLDGAQPPGLPPVEHGDDLTSHEAGGAAQPDAEQDPEVAGVAPSLQFTTRTGHTYVVDGRELPYGRIHTLDLAPVGLQASIAPPWARVAPVEWFRSLSLGSSHGMMVALMTYADASGHDLAQTRHIAGTGGIRGDGTVTRIGGLEAKAQAARRQGVDVLLFPASQAPELEGFDARGMQLVPITTLDDAIRYLDRPLA
jgi:hypothetical protein